MKKRFVVIAGAASLLAIIGCSGGSWEETNAFSPVADATNAAGSGEEENPISTESSSSADVKYSSVAYSNGYVNAGTTVEPASSPNADEPSSGHVIDFDLPKGGVSSGSMVVSPSSYAVPSSSYASMQSSSSTVNMSVSSSNSSGMGGSPITPADTVDKDSSYIPFDPSVVETVTIGSQVWMKKLAAGGQALTWEAAMAAGVCPAGFHVPTYGEVDSLLHMAADGSIVGRENDGIGIITDGSKRVRDLGWSEHFGRFWTTEEFGESGAYYFAVSDTEADALMHGDQRTNEFYVRCIKN
ncbi:MAG: hypothetical protein II892_06055 [Fibrobacter sp.]|nr:hypothetical protein [Fibrobacter sp.]